MWAHIFLVVPNMTLSVDDELFAEIKRHKEIKWSEVARQAFRRKLDHVHVWDRLLAESELTEADISDVARDVDESMARRFEALD